MVHPHFGKCLRIFSKGILWERILSHGLADPPVGGHQDTKVAIRQCREGASGTLVSLAPPTPQLDQPPGLLYGT